MNHKLRNYWGAEMAFFAAFSAVVREIEKYALYTTNNTRVRNHLSKNLENYFLALGLAYFSEPKLCERILLILVRIPGIAFNIIRTNLVSIARLPAALFV